MGQVNMSGPGQIRLPGTDNPGCQAKNRLGGQADDEPGCLARTELAARQRDRSGKQAEDVLR